MATHKNRKADPTREDNLPPKKYRVGQLVEYRGVVFRVAKHVWDAEHCEWGIILGEPNNTPEMNRQICDAYDDGLN
jgi:hypothetical protein